MVGIGAALIKSVIVNKNTAMMPLLKLSNSGESVFPSLEYTADANAHRKAALSAANSPRARSAETLDKLLTIIPTNGRHLWRDRSKSYRLQRA